MLSQTTTASPAQAAVLERAISLLKALKLRWVIELQGGDLLGDATLLQTPPKHDRSRRPNTNNHVAKHNYIALLAGAGVGASEMFVCDSASEADSLRGSICAFRSRAGIPLQVSASRSGDAEHWVSVLVLASPAAIKLDNERITRP